MIHLLLEGNCRQHMVPADLENFATRAAVSGRPQIDFVNKSASPYQSLYRDCLPAPLVGSMAVEGPRCEKRLFRVVAMKKPKSVGTLDIPLEVVRRWITLCVH